MNVRKLENTGSKIAKGQGGFIYPCGSRPLEALES